jgi:hypothetical protein
MKAAIIIFIIFVSFLIGSICGFLFEMRTIVSNKNIMQDYDGAKMAQLAICLTMLRSNKQDMATEALEGMLDDDLMIVAAQIRSGRKNMINEKEIQIVRNYRSEHKRSVDTNIDALIEEVLGTNNLRSIRVP